MKLYIKQKLFSWGDRFAVRDENGVDRYFVRGEVFSFGHRLHITDPAGEELAAVVQKVFAFRPRYLIQKGGETAAELVREFSFFTENFRFEGSPWRIEGNFLGHEFRLFDERTGAVLMTVSKEWFTWGDSYVLDIAGGADEVLCIAAVIAIDCVAADASHSAGNP